MFSGKTTEMLRRVNRLKLSSLDCMVIKYAGDSRYNSNEDFLITHDNVKFRALACNKLEEALTKAKSCNVIGVDEGQFFPDLIPFCDSMADNGKTVIVSALDGTFERKPFENVTNLIPLSESVVKLNAVCMSCNAEAAFSRRLSSEREVKVIGGLDKYMAVCRTCFHKKTIDKRDNEKAEHDMIIR
eukprot:Nk52_evm30s158 gene=Nk52_evmTU30s158